MMKTQNHLLNLLLIVAVTFAGGAWTSAAADAEGDAGAAILTQDYATGDWFGRRGELEDAGFDFQAALVADWSTNFHGGVDTSGSALRSLLDANLTAGLEQVLRLTRLVGVDVSVVPELGDSSDSNCASHRLVADGSKGRGATPDRKELRFCIERQENHKLATAV